MDEEISSLAVVFADLESRFLANIPHSFGHPDESAPSSDGDDGDSDDDVNKPSASPPVSASHHLVRFFFQLELAHWFYMDHILPLSRNKTKQQLGKNDSHQQKHTQKRLLEYAHGFYMDHILPLSRNKTKQQIGKNDSHQQKHTQKRLPDLENFRHFARTFYKYDQHLSDDTFDADIKVFEAYRAKIPIYGCILLNPGLTRCVLVQSINGTRWGFPKGKIDENEPEFQCAVREVLEEVGVDVGDRVQENDVISTDFRGRKFQLYIIQNIPDETEFKTRTRGEIGRIEWFDLDTLPGGANHEQHRSKQPPRGGGGGKNNAGHRTPTPKRGGHRGRRTPGSRGRGRRGGNRGGANRRYSVERTYAEKTPSGANAAASNGIAPRFNIPLKVCIELRRWVQRRSELGSGSGSGSNSSSASVSPPVASSKKPSPTPRYRRVMPERSQTSPVFPSDHPHQGTASAAARSPPGVGALAVSPEPDSSPLTLSTTHLTSPPMMPTGMSSSVPASPANCGIASRSSPFGAAPRRAAAAAAPLPRQLDALPSSSSSSRSDSHQHSLFNPTKRLSLPNHHFSMFSSGSLSLPAGQVGHTTHSALLGAQPLTRSLPTSPRSQDADARSQSVHTLAPHTSSLDASAVAAHSPHQLLSRPAAPSSVPLQPPMHLLASGVGVGIGVGAVGARGSGAMSSPASLRHTPATVNGRLSSSAAVAAPAAKAMLLHKPRSHSNGDATAPGGINGGKRSLAEFFALHKAPGKVSTTLASPDPPLSSATNVGNAAAIQGRRHLDHRRHLMRGGVATAPSSLTRREHSATASSSSSSAAAAVSTAPSSLTRSSNSSAAASRELLSATHASASLTLSSSSGPTVQSARSSISSSSTPPLSNTPRNLLTAPRQRPSAAAESAASLHSHSLNIEGGAWRNGGAAAAAAAVGVQHQKRSHSEAPLHHFHYAHHHHHRAATSSSPTQPPPRVAQQGASHVGDAPAPGPKLDQSLSGVSIAVSAARNGAPLSEESPKQDATPASAESKSTSDASVRDSVSAPADSNTSRRSPPSSTSSSVPAAGQHHAAAAAAALPQRHQPQPQQPQLPLPDKLQQRRPSRLADFKFDLSSIVSEMSLVGGSVGEGTDAPPTIGGSPPAAAATQPPQGGAPKNPSALPASASAAVSTPPKQQKKSRRSPHRGGGGGALPKKGGGGASHKNHSSKSRKSRRNRGA